MRMDHHCPWTGNCVGLKNNKYFICFLFWTIIACLFAYVSTNCLTTSMVPLKGGVQGIYGFFEPATAGGLSLGVSIGVSLLLLMHTYLQNTNSTSLEAGELSTFNPYRLEKRSDNNSEILGRSFINKLNPFSVPKEEYKNQKNELYCDGLIYPLNQDRISKALASVAR